MYVLITFPFFGICLGMQLAVVEYCRNVLGLADANSAEFDMDSKNHVIDIMPDQNMWSSLVVPCVWVNILARLCPDTKAAEIYGDNLIYERHRHRFEVNNDYREQLEQAGMIFSGRAPDNPHC